MNGLDFENLSHYNENLCDNHRLKKIVTSSPKKNIHLFLPILKDTYGGKICLWKVSYKEEFYDLKIRKQMEVYCEDLSQ